MTERNTKCPVPTVIHVSIDYDNAHRGRPTLAIKQFIEQLSDLNNIVFSMKRTANPFKVSLSKISSGEYLTVFQYNYFGLPGGILLFFSMFIVGKRIARILRKDGIRAHAVHGHKVSFEGIAAWIVARELGLQLILSVRGEVEKKVFRYKVGYRRLFQKIHRRSAYVYFVSAWFSRPYFEYVSDYTRAVEFLPNVVKNAYDNITPAPPTKQALSVLNLNDFRRKGLLSLLDSIKLLSEKGILINLDVIGGGGRTAVDAVIKHVERRGLQRQVTFLGKLSNEEVLKIMPNYALMALPSENETFGMVYAEALFAGVPVIMNKSSGVDGYLDGIDVAMYVNPGDVKELAAALLKMTENTKYYRERIEANAKNIYDRFSSFEAVSLYRSRLWAIAADAGE